VNRVIAVVKDLFFVARIRETARLVGTPLDFARAPEEVAPALAAGPADLVILDLTTNGWDYDVVLDAIERATPRVPVLGFTTHALARLTQPLHGRCERVVTKETLTQELPQVAAQVRAAWRNVPVCVVPAAGGTGGYRWGKARKEQLLRFEAERG